jgi:phage terminase Nu1 subunit (DNA packaging protein)
MTVSSQIEVDQSTFAALIGKTPQTVRDWTAEGMPGVRKPVHPDGRVMRNATLVNLLQAIPWVISTKLNASADDRARLRRIQADAAELDLLVKQGTLILVSDVQATWSTECAAMRARLLSLPSTAAAKIGSTMTLTQRQAVIRDEVHEALTCLSAPVIMSAPEPEPATKKPARAKARPAKPKPRKKAARV